jgi:hypothetical protein
VERTRGARSANQGMTNLLVGMGRSGASFVARWVGQDGFAIRAPLNLVSPDMDVWAEPARERTIQDSGSRQPPRTLRTSLPSKPNVLCAALSKPRQVLHRGCGLGRDVAKLASGRSRPHLEHTRRSSVAMRLGPLIQGHAYFHICCGKACTSLSREGFWPRHPDWRDETPLREEGRARRACSARTVSSPLPGWHWHRGDVHRGCRAHRRARTLRATLDTDASNMTSTNRWVKRLGSASGEAEEVRRAPQALFARTTN